MLFKIFKFIFIPIINFPLSRILRPFSSWIPVKYHFPVIGKYHLQIDTNHSIYLEGHYTSHLSKLIFWQGVRGWEYDNIRLFIELIQKSDTFLDIGANIGYYSLLASGLQPHIRTIAFEPFPDAYAALNDNIQINGFKNIQAESIALSDQKGTFDFFYKVNPTFKDYKYQLAGDNGLVDYDEDVRQQSTVNTITLDEYMESQNLDQIDLMKMDTETTEYFILKGGQKTLSKFQPIIMCEVLKGFHEKELEELLRSLNYTFFKVTPMGLKASDTIIQNKTHQNQYFFVPTQKHDLIQDLIAS